MMGRGIVNMNKINTEWMQLKLRFKRKDTKEWENEEVINMMGREIVNMNVIHMEWMQLIRRQEWENTFIHNIDIDIDIDID